MNRRIILYVVGKVLRIEGIIMLLPLVTALLYAESDALFYLLCGGLCYGFGFLLSFRRPDNTVFYLKEGCIATSLSWIALSLFGSLPFILTGDIPNFTDAVFETVSGFTTTGASILNDVEALSHANALWRCFTHWIGGMGVLVFLLAVLPMSSGSNMNLMRAESPGPTVGKLVPRVRESAKILYLIYIVMTLVQFILLVCSNMPLFHAFCIAVGTAGTGGFGLYNDSAGSYTAVQQWIITAFMILFGVNFNFYYFLYRKEYKKMWEIEEVRAYFAIIFTSSIMICFNVLGQVGSQLSNFGDALRAAFFQVGSVISSTGFSTVDYNAWPTLSKGIICLLMFFGACAGSTGGGFKISRILILIKLVRREVGAYFHPKIVKKLKMDGKSIDNETVRSTSAYLVIYLFIFLLSFIFVCFDHDDLVTCFTAVCACLNNIGPGLNSVGPAANFSILSVFSKWVLIFDMIAGRLELFPMLILLHPSTWKAFWERGKTKAKAAA